MQNIKLNNKKRIMGILGITGHTTRGKEVIELLEMLGGYNFYKLGGNGWNCIYYIDQNKQIRVDTAFPNKTFNLDSFLAQFPYKVGDKVIFKGHIEIINRMGWDGETIKYGFSTTRDVSEARAEDLQSYKEQEEIMKENKTTITFDCNQVDKGVELIIPQGMELFVQDGKVILIDKKPKYPRTLDECCDILGIKLSDNLRLSERVIFSYKIVYLACLQELLIYRDAYWKIAGDWKYDVNKTEEYFYIVNRCGHIAKEHYMNFNHILSFPTEEMRDAFYENFKELIESCKELL